MNLYVFHNKIYLFCWSYFLIFVNDLIDDLECDPFLFADDTSLLCPLEQDNDVSSINTDLKNVSDWATQWQVTFNASKTVYILFSKKLEPPYGSPITLNGVPIKRVESHCHLGVTLSENLSWETHVSICKCACVSVNLLKRMNYNINRKTKLMIYKVFIRPRLEYANALFGNNLTKNQADPLENVQRQALLCCLGTYRHTSHAMLLQEVGIEPLSIRRKYFRLCQLYKMINNLCPRYLSMLIPPYVYEASSFS